MICHNNKVACLFAKNFLQAILRNQPTTTAHKATGKKRKGTAMDKLVALEPDAVVPLLCTVTTIAMFSSPW